MTDYWLDSTLRRAGAAVTRRINSTWDDTIIDLTADTEAGTITWTPGYHYEQRICADAYGKHWELACWDNTGVYLARSRPGAVQGTFVDQAGSGERTTELLGELYRVVTG